MKATLAVDGLAGEKVEVEDFCDYCRVGDDPERKHECNKCIRGSHMTDRWEPNEEYPG